MKKSGMTYVLLGAAVVVWGVIAWKLVVSRRPETIAVMTESSFDKGFSERCVDTLMADYPDPFLKDGGTGSRETVDAGLKRSPVRADMTAKRSDRKPLAAEHYGTVRTGTLVLYIMLLDGQQYEVELGDSIAGFVLAAVDADSLYLAHKGNVYGVELCR